MRISYSYGIMDLFHYGHLKALRAAAEGADLHIVGLVADGAAKSWIGSVVSNEKERRAVLESIECVDWVMPQQTLDPTENLKKLHYIYPEAEITLFRGDGISVIAAREYLRSIGGSVKSIDYYERLSPAEILTALNARTELSDRHSAVISTKANTLLALRERIKLAHIEDIAVVTVREARENPRAVAERIRAQFGGSKIVVRSSSVGEDSFDSSNAGHYESVLGIDSLDGDAVLGAIRTVYESYGKDGTVGNDEQVLIQTQTQDVRYSGVVFTRDIQQNRPYYIISYDDSGSTDSVTSGAGGRSIEIAQDASEDSVPYEWQGLYRAVKELEAVLSKMLLDIEFAVTGVGEVVIFQVRPLAASYKFGRISDTSRLLEIKNTEKRLYADFRNEGGSPVMSDMAFWNPAEIIGSSPHLLDYSLYRRIITHRAWNEGLVPLGYRRVGEDLMYRYGLKPYICVDYAFRSLIPAAVSETLADKLCAFYLSELKKDLSAHDKIEFEIALSAFDFSTEKKLAVLQESGFSADECEELKRSLRGLTENAVTSYQRVLEEDSRALQQLEQKRAVTAKLFTKELDAPRLSVLVKELLDAVSSLGTPQFARQARYAFIARSFADSLKSEKIWTESEYDSFMASIDTVAGKFERDFSAFQRGTLPREVFDERYGHLRAGTYDIRKLPYAKMDFTPSIDRNTGNSDSPTVAECAVSIPESALSNMGLHVQAADVIYFMRSALEMREQFKFEFTKSLSFAIEIMAAMAERLGFKRADMSYFDVNEILSFSFYGTEEEIKHYISKELPRRKTEHKLMEKLILPSVITKDTDFDFIQSIDSRPNFITQKSVTAETAVLDENEEQDIAGKIVIIEKADPGYDWIFAKNIAGLVTRYGGVASHMAIRCAEFELPAAIGCGEKIFNYVCKQDYLELDCKHGKVRGVIK